MRDEVTEAKSSVEAIVGFSNRHLIHLKVARIGSLGKRWGTPLHRLSYAA